MSIEENLQTVRENINKAAQRGGRDPQNITLVAVTKTHDIETMRAAIDSGVTHIGENKAQEMRDKYDQLERNVDWHFIGHLQRNKVKYVIDKAVMIHSVDRFSLAREISRRALKYNRMMPVLIEVNVSGEETKFGVTPQELTGLIKQMESLDGLKCRGLMTMAPHTDDPEDTRPIFRKLRKLFDDLNAEGYPMDVLSMGMTNDYIVAVEEGATHVRVGTAIFGQRDYSK